MATSAVLVLADGFEEVEAVTPIDLLRRAGVEVTVLGLDSLEVRGSHDIRVKADGLLAAMPHGCDALILPGGQPGTTNLGASPDLLREVRRMHERGGLCAAICAAPTVLAKAGILSERAATCYPGLEKQLAGAICSQSPVVVDGNIITSRGAGTAVPFGLELVRYLCGHAVAAAVADAIVFAR